MCVCVCTKFQYSSIILTSFRQGGNFPHRHPPTTSKLITKRFTQIKDNAHSNFLSSSIQLKTQSSVKTSNGKENATVLNVLFQPKTNMLNSIYRKLLNILQTVSIYKNIKALKFEKDWENYIRKNSITQKVNETK